MLNGTLARGVPTYTRLRTKLLCPGLMLSHRQMHLGQGYKNSWQCRVSPC